MSTILQLKKILIKQNTEKHRNKKNRLELYKRAYS